MVDDWWLPPDIGPDGEPLDDDASTLVPGLAPSTVMDEPADVANLAEFQDGSEDNDSCQMAAADCCWLPLVTACRLLLLTFWLLLTAGWCQLLLVTVSGWMLVAAPLGCCG